MAAVFGGVARAPFTSIAFLFELSHNPNSLLPLIVCVMVSNGLVGLLSRDSIMTEKLTRRGFIVLQDYSVPVLMRSRIDQVMHKEFHTVQADAEVGAVLRNLTPAHMGLLPVVERNGSMVGIVEAEDLLRVAPPDHHFKMRELARQDYVLAYPGELIDRVSRDMLSKNVENIVVVEPSLTSKPVGVARANDILQLRRWLMDEESRELPRHAKDKLKQRLRSDRRKMGDAGLVPGYHDSFQLVFLRGLWHTKRFRFRTRKKLSRSRLTVRSAAMR